MRSLAVAICSFAFTFGAFGQSDRGTITGTISDPTGAVAAGSPVEIRNVENGEVGSNTESVTVTDAAPLLKTESGELSHTVTTSTMNSLPVMGIGGAAGSSGMRNPYAVVQLLPGTTYSPDVDIRINGMPANTQAMRIEGQDATNGWSNRPYLYARPPVRYC